LKSIAKLIVVAALAYVPFLNAEELHANELVPVVMGEVYDQIFTIKSDTKEGPVHISYFPAGQSIKQWSRQMSYSEVVNPDVKTPEKLASTLVTRLNMVSPGSKYKASASEDGQVVVLDFIVDMPAQNLMELNVHRIQKFKDRLYNIHSVVRMPRLVNPTPETAAPLIELRNYLVTYIVKQDIAKISDVLDTAKNETVEE